MKKSKVLTIVFLSLGVSTLLVSIAALFHPSFFRTHDYTQGARIIEMFRGFQDGQIPVRWSKNFGFGYGMPTFLFYAPLPYIVGSAWYWVTKDLIFSLKIIWALPSIFSFLGMYRLVEKKFGRLAGLVAATLFTLAPYRAVDLYVRGAIGEVWAIGFFPWILLAIDNWFNNKKRLDPVLVILVSLLFITHNLMAMFFAPVIIMFGFLTWFFNNKKKFLDLIWFSIQNAIALGLSAFYILPAITEKNATQIDSRILSGYFHYSQHFLYIRQFFTENWKYGGSVWGPNDDMSFFLGYAQLLGLILLFLLSCWAVLKLYFYKRFTIKKIISTTSDKYQKQFPVVFTSLFFFPASLLLCTQKSQFFWGSVGLLQTAQFPWRFLSLSICFLAILGGVAITLVSHRTMKMLLAAFLVGLTIYTGTRYFHPEAYLDDPQALYYADEQRIRSEMSITWPDFLPAHFGQNLTATNDRYHLLKDSGQSKEVAVVVDRSHQLLLKTRFGQPEQLVLHIANFPGWTVLLNDQKVTAEETVDGLLTIEVPAGEQWVAADFERTPVRNIADFISILCLAILVYSQIVVTRQKATL